MLGERLLASTSTESCGAAASMLAVLIGLSEEGFVPRRDISFYIRRRRKISRTGCCLCRSLGDAERCDICCCGS